MNFEQIINQSQFTILLGKNGSGKSTLLRRLSSENPRNIKYISPERGGILKHNPNVESSMTNPGWTDDSRRKNRSEQFREQSAIQFRNLELSILREIESDPYKRQDTSYTFSTTINEINRLLPEIRLEREDRGFSVKDNEGKSIDVETISSGESELVALAIEILVFSRLETEAKILLLDEPDVHMHPDLQSKFVQFLEKIAIEKSFNVIIATHSTAIISSFTDKNRVQIVPISNKSQHDFSSFKHDTIVNELLPVFGAHPLSSVFIKSPIVLVEGEDDKRVLDQVVRSSNGRIRLSPCVIGGVGNFKRWEDWLLTFLPSIYDSPSAFSLRDLDDSAQDAIDDTLFIVRIRLNCYSIENILISNECLQSFGYSEESFCNELREWLNLNTTHCNSSSMNRLIDNFANRRTIKIKDIRNIIVAILDPTKPWEVIVGQLISNLISPTNDTETENDNGIFNYLGNKLIDKLLKKTRSS